MLNRTITSECFQAEGGLWEVDGHLVDTRGYDIHTKWRGEVPKGRAIHEMWMRITFREDMVIRAIEVVTDAAPYPASCPEAAGQYQNLVGLQLGDRFSRQIRERVGGASGCTHQTELLRAMSTIAMRTYYTHIMNKGDTGAAAGTEDQEPPIAIIGSCHALAADGEVVAEIWPQGIPKPLP